MSILSSELPSVPQQSARDGSIVTISFDCKWQHAILIHTSDCVILSCERASEEVLFAFLQPECPSFTRKTEITQPRPILAVCCCGQSNLIEFSETKATAT